MQNVLRIPSSRFRDHLLKKYTDTPPDTQTHKHTPQTHRDTQTYARTHTHTNTRPLTTYTKTYARAHTYTHTIAIVYIKIIPEKLVLFLSISFEFPISLLRFMALIYI